jgi:stringent starvation protein B
MTSTKPYLIRAIRDWAMDNHLTPQILVDVTMDGVDVPEQHVNSGQIILNIGDQAVQLEQMDNETMAFSARFGGVPSHVTVPIDSVIAIYARENGQGIFFRDPQNPTEPGPEAESKSTKPNLKLIK